MNIYLFIIYLIYLFICSCIDYLFTTKHFLWLYYGNNPKYWVRQAFANSVDQKQQNVASKSGSTLFAIHTAIF